MSLFKTDTSRIIFLARHGESIANLNKQVSGQLDVPLSAKGKQQAIWLKEVLENEVLSAIYTSSLVRTIETAAPTATHHQLDIQVIDDLKERHFGALQGKQFADTDSDVYGDKQQSMLNLKDAENINAFECRIIECLTYLLNNSTGTILIVGHRNTNQVILAQLLSLGSTSRFTINIKNKYVYEILLREMPEVSTIRLGGESHGKKYLGLKDD